MSSQLDSVIQLGQDILSFKYFLIANFVILFYDYFLTLGDEVKYAWSGRKSWVFWVFLINRYLPMTLMCWELAGYLLCSAVLVLWVLIGPLSPEIQYHTTRSRHLHLPTRCNSYSFYPLAMFVFSTLIAQTVLTVRMYAVTMKNISIALCFAAITVAQFALGVVMTVIVGKNGAQPHPPIPLDSYHLCVFSQPPRRLEDAYAILSLCYDALAFSLVTLWARKTKTRCIHFTTILDTIAEDATWYFMVIFSSHFVLVMTLNLGRVTIQLLPGCGVLVYLPVMISRIMLSLKKAANSTKGAWSLTEKSTYEIPVHTTMSFASPQMGQTEQEEDSMPHTAS